MDIKVSAKKRMKRPRRKTKFPMRVRDGNVIPYKYSYAAIIASGTTGIVSNSLSPTIQNSSEYSTLQALYTEIKLLKCNIIFTSMVPNTTTGQSRVVVATNMNMNNSVFTLPAALSDVQNSKNVKIFPSSAPFPRVYRMFIPRFLEYSNIVADAPNPVTPYAGSPGIVQVYGSGFNNSTNVFTVDIICWFMLRGRQ